MKQRRTLLIGALFYSFISFPILGQDSLSDLLAQPGAGLDDPDSRAQIVASLKAASERRRGIARARAQGLGLPIRITHANGVVQEVTDFEGDLPTYFTTSNVNAAISTGADLVRVTHSVEGSGITVGLWDGGGARTSHQEFGTRFSIMDGAGFDDHATHVGGTIAAAGASPTAKGMAPLATVDSYDWNGDLTEMTARAATAPGQVDKIYLSNHSYNFVTGWNFVNNGTRVWEWWGDGTGSSSFEQDYGRYHPVAQDHDALAYSAPYYLIFRSAGNDRTDNPSNGQLVALSPGNETVVAFDTTQHPTGDGQYRGGFETIAFAAVAKNVVTVGSASDAVTSGIRDPSKANVSSFSCWGPTDDGRIKPDLVANGEAVYSPLAGSDTAYGSFWGTSMSTPNTTGSAALLVEQYANLFSGGAMRSSTLKALLIHTADDRGNVGPDYKYGWGLVDAKEAADLISNHKLYPERELLTEAGVTTSNATYSRSFTWDGSSPIRATLCWTDPAGTPTSSSDSRTPRLVNNLNLKIIAPGDTEYFPFVMPFVGTWTEASMNSPATTGVNNTDNVEQVLISAPPAAGTYQVEVTYSGALTNNTQEFGLILSGASSEIPPPSITEVSPSSSIQETTTLTVSGTNLFATASVKLSREGYPDITASNIQLANGNLNCQFDLRNTALGLWDLTITNPDSQNVTLNQALRIYAPLWRENFDSAPRGWSSSASTGSHSWAVTNALSQSPSSSYFISGPASKTTTSLISPAIPISPHATNLQLSFWHNYSLQSSQDGGRLEFSLDGGAWFDVTDTNSGVSFASGGYNTIISSSGNPSGRSDFSGLQVWSGTSGGFVEARINLDDTAKFSGSSLQLRWSLATNSSTASAGWYVDSITLSGDIAFSSWQGTQFSSEQVTAGEAAENFDADGDGLSNFAEYALGTDPNVVNESPTATRLDAGVMTLSFERPIGLGDVIYDAEISDTLGGWSPIPLQSIGMTSSMEMMQAQVLLPQDINSLFIRLRLTSQ